MPETSAKKKEKDATCTVSLRRAVVWLADSLGLKGVDEGAAVEQHGEKVDRAAAVVALSLFEVAQHWEWLPPDLPVGDGAVRPAVHKLELLWVRRLFRHREGRVCEHKAHYRGLDEQKRPQEKQRHRRDGESVARDHSACSAKQHDNRNVARNSAHARTHIHAVYVCMIFLSFSRTPYRTGCQKNVFIRNASHQKRFPSQSYGLDALDLKRGRTYGSTMSSSETPKTFDSDAPAVSTSSESSFESDPDEARSPAAPRVARRAAAKPPRATPRRACTPHGNETHTARPPRATTPSQQQPPRTANAARAADVRISILRTVIKPQLHQPFSPLQRCVQSFLLHSYRCGQHTHHFCFCCCVFFWSTTNLQLFSSAQSTFSSHFGQSSRLQHVEHCFNRGSSRLESALFEKPPPSRCLRDAPSRIRCERA
mmetsp:Transcript_9380/g.24859  ORF Transcript_9380/g.24859 Transcript_9380/m.24859 type:complete len:425 (-) Transcript_9380:4953-6227(-)